MRKIQRSNLPVLHPAHQRKATFLLAADGRKAGRLQVIGNRLTLWKPADPHKHMLRLPPAWALDAKVLRDAERAGAVDVEIRERGGRKRRWRVSLGAFRSHGFDFCRSAGPQVGLALEHWTVVDPAGAQGHLFGAAS